MERYCVVKEEVVDDVIVGAEVLHATETDSRAEAEAAAEAAAKANQTFGYDEGRGSWWGKNTGGYINRFTAAEVGEARRMIEAANDG